MFRLRENEQGLKFCFLINMLMYSVFSFAIMNYVGAAANLFAAVTTAVSLIRGIKQNKAENGPDNAE